MNMHNAQNTISVSSTVHKYLTGNLKKTNKGFPPDAGTEYRALPIPPHSLCSRCLGKLSWTSTPLAMRTLPNHLSASRRFLAPGPSP